MRILDKEKIAYQAHEYPHGDEAVDGVHVAALLNQNPDYVFKTLVARGKSNGIYVFVIPVAAELDLKKAAKAVGEKEVAMIPVKEINTVTGYVRGGCSPVGMKKAYPTVFHATALENPCIIVSAGKIGYQIETTPQAFIQLVHGKTAEIIVNAQHQEKAQTDKVHQYAPNK